MLKTKSILPPVALFFMCVLGLALNAGCSAAGDVWPKKAITLVVTFAAGGGSDVAGRVMAKHLARELGVPVNVENKPGGNQIPGIQAVLDAAPDGYTLLLEQPANSSIECTMKDVPFKIEERTYGPLMVTGPNTYAVSAKSPYKTLKDLLEAGWKDPGSITWAYTGYNVTSFSHVQLFRAGGIDPSKTKPVEFSGGGPANTAVAGGHVVLAGGGPGGVLPLYKSGDLRILAVTGDKRAAVLPDVPTGKEQGYDLNIINWFGISGPKNLPKNVLERLDVAAKKITSSPEYARDLENEGSVPLYMSPSDTRDFVLKEFETMKKLAADLGIAK